MISSPRTVAQVICVISARARLPLATLLMNVFDFILEMMKIGNHELPVKRRRQQLAIVANDALEAVVVNARIDVFVVHIFNDKVLTRIQIATRIGKSRIRQEIQASFARCTNKALNVEKAELIL